MTRGKPTNAQVKRRAEQYRWATHEMIDMIASIERKIGELRRARKHDYEQLQNMNEKLSRQAKEIEALKLENEQLCATVNGLKAMITGMIVDSYLTDDTDLRYGDQ